MALLHAVQVGSSTGFETLSAVLYKVNMYSPANLILIRSRGCNTIVEITPPLSPAARFSYLMCFESRRRLAVREKEDPEESAATAACLCLETVAVMFVYVLETDSLSE